MLEKTHTLNLRCSVGGNAPRPCHEARAIARARANTRPNQENERLGERCFTRPKLTRESYKSLAQVQKLFAQILSLSTQAL